MMVIGLKELPITDIIIGDRGRQNMGKIEKLSKSILKNGQEVPIVITEDYELIDGGRRLEALSQLGVETVMCNIARLVEKDSILKLEFSMNEDRKSFNDRERLAMLSKMKLPHGGDRKSSTSAEVLDKSNKTPKQIRNEKAKAVGFSSASEAGRVKAIYDKGCDELIKYVEDGKIVKSLGAKISYLTHEEQKGAIHCHIKYGAGKWWYYELPKTLINNLEKGNISRDECDGYMISYRSGRMTGEQISTDITALIKAKTKAIGNAKAEKMYDANKHEAKWDTIEVSSDNRIQSFRNIINYFEQPSKTDVSEIIRKIYKELENER